MTENSLIRAASFIPNSLQFPNAWVGHLPFAAWVIQEISPKIFVEIGTHSGNSYFSFCQSVKEANLATKCYAVDTWQGDVHAGNYGDEVFHQVNAHNQAHYANFSRLLRMTFDDAASYFSDGSIELLHIDGLHTYEAVKHDFETWLPKLAPGAVVLFHDTNVRERGFGVWKLWEELQTRYPNNIEFLHAHGLGVLQLDGALDDKKLLWLDPQSVEQQQLKDYFSALGARQLERFELGQTKTHVVNLNQAVAERDGQIGNLNQAVAERDGQIANLNQTATERDGQIANLNQTATERDGQIANLNQALQDARSSLGKLLLSNSWRITKPLRFVRRISISKSYVILRAKASNVSRNLWYSLPLSFSVKRKFKDAMFSALPWIFGWTKAYRAWTSFNTSENFSGLTNRAVHSQQAYNNEYVRLFKGKPLIEKPVKLICFYLPQFHAIPENNAWWGNGFTEWANVQPAQPQFDGHYQPHVPGELGYYNLLDPSVQSRQVELAKLYGIEGFCFYFYWFGGKRLLETPIENYLNDSSLDLPFCLCWANENWSRRWDGLDSEILMEQHHSPEDDLAFIQHVASYMHNFRYIRIGGKPLLLVYRPSLLPSAKETAKRWREWCINNGIGEIFLAYTQSFETVDPKKYGFDAAIEFPPNNSSPPNITDSVTPLVGDFGATVYDWRAFIERSNNYNRPKYKLFRGVCPAWDNTARRKSKGSILINSSPQGYQEWLYNAIADTRARFEKADERLIFINAWNEWAEGAHLEPDQRYGYAYLEATRMAQVRSASRLQVKTDVLAIVVHAFYEDVFAEIIERLHEIKEVPFKLFVTTTHEKGASIDDILKSSGFPYELLPVANHGRDVLPFLKIINRVVDEGYAYILKTHTKKSNHRKDGDIWRRDLYDKLLNENSICRALDTFNRDANVGLIGPSEHVVPMNFYWGSNAMTIESLARRLGQAPEKIKPLTFIAGTMFFARTDALAPLLNMAIEDADFEPEGGQVDGTLAHALERAVSISCKTKSYDLVDTDMNKVGYASTNYRFVSN